MELFATFVKIDGASSASRDIVEKYLKQNLNSLQVEEYLQVYDESLRADEKGLDSEKKKKRLSLNSVKIVVICNRISEELNQKQRLAVLLKLTEFVLVDKVFSENEKAFLDIAFSSFNVADSVYTNIFDFFLKEPNELAEISNYLLITSSPLDGFEGKTLLKEGLQGKVGVLYFPEENLLIAKPEIVSEFYINGQIPDSKFIVIPQGANLKGPKSEPIYYTDIIACFLNEKQGGKLSFEVQDVSYRFATGEVGIHPITIKENSGKLIGIMGGSGAGKSTLLNILNGNLKPSTGRVLVNDLDIHQSKKQSDGIIGFVTQDDLLVEELTVYQNLYFNAKLCFGNLNESELSELVLKVLNQLGLFEIKDLQVGDVFNKVISGGQRKRLNIALELIREPLILFADEPTSGLSSRDSENVIDLLKELAMKGKLVFVVIHQPSSDIFKLFDKLLVLDKGGYLAYYGNPLNAVTFFKHTIHHHRADESECYTCGNVNPEQIFSIIETKVIDEFGNSTRARKVSPKEWSLKFQEAQEKKENSTFEKSSEPLQLGSVKPSKFQQFLTYFKRDILAKWTNKQYIFLTVAEPFLLALLLALVLRKSGNNGYVFMENNNLPAFLFICVIVSLFLGLMLSSEEIFKDRKLLKREAFLNLDWGSYIYSKIVVVFLISAAQTFLFSLVGTLILEIKGMLWSYWFILFSTSFFANMLGLNISSAFNSAVTIYILIPLLIIPQIMLSGILVKYHDLFEPLASKTKVPVIGEIMASRWAYEALVVDQYVNNAYEKRLFPLDQKIKRANYIKTRLVNFLDKKVDEWNVNPSAHAENSNLLKNEINDLKEEVPPALRLKMDQIDFTDRRACYDGIKTILSEVKVWSSASYDKLQAVKDTYFSQVFSEETSKTAFMENQKKYYNKSLSNFIASVPSDESNQVLENNHLYKTDDPIYTDAPNYQWIRAHYFAPNKNFFGKKVSTFWVNSFVIWMMSFLLFLFLKIKGLKKMMDKLA